MGTFANLTDRAALSELGARLARHRLERNLTQAALAQEAGVSKRTVIRLEAGESTQLTNLIRVARALGLLGGLEAFVPGPMVSPIERLRLRQRERKRASPRPRRTGPARKWTWGDEGNPSKGAA